MVRSLFNLWIFFFYIFEFSEEQCLDIRAVKRVKYKLVIYVHFGLALCLPYFKTASVKHLRSETRWGFFFHYFFSFFFIFPERDYCPL